MTELTAPVTGSEEAFRLLGLQRTKGWTTRRSEVVLLAGPICHAIDGEGFRHLLLPLEESAVEVQDDASRGVSVSTHDLVNSEGVQQPFVDVRCNESRLIDLFSVVCGEVVELAAEYSDRPGAACTIVLDRWRELLGPGSRRLIGENALKGLIAELHVLEDVAKANPAKALALWTGPDEARHDFIGATTVIEVKASSLVDDVRVQIHGLTQLEEPSGKSLFLIVERLEVEPAGKDSLSDVIERLVQLGVSKAGLYRALADSGVEPAHVEPLSVLRVDRKERRAYTVDGDFPRLTSAMITGLPAQDRVSRVSYTLDLGAQPPVPLEEPWTESVVSRLLTEAGEVAS